MHPEIIRDRPGACPICGMDLVPMTSHGPEHSAADTMAAPAAAMPAEHTEVHLESDRLQLIGVRVGRVERRPLAGEVRTSAVIAADEGRLAAVHTRTAGWLDRLLVARVGERVSRGQAVAQLESFDLIAAQEDYLAAVRSVKALGESAIAGGDLLDAAKRRLRLLGMTDGDIARLTQSRKVSAAVSVVSPSAGVVVGREVVEGRRVEPGTTLLTVADLSRVWALLDIYEDGIAQVRRGQKAEVEIPALTNAVFRGEVDYVYPLLDERTRTTKARVVLANPDGRLFPGMFGSARIFGDSREALVIPREALIDNGREQYAFVVAGPGHFVPTSVRVGRREADVVEILDGLTEGQEVATSANFLLDSESRMLAGAAKSGSGGHEQHP
jgi:Cu(I)/Ag(I) efflux system membrane fusion protein